MKIKPEIMKLYPDTKELTLGGKICLQYEVSTPAHIFNVFNFPVENGVIAQIKVRDVFSISLLESLSKQNYLLGVSLAGR